MSVELPLAALCRHWQDYFTAQQMHEFADQREQAIRKALEESVKLQSHYASLLNMHDGGQRMTFTVETWLNRLDATKTNKLS